MPIFEIQGPDGRIYEADAPDMESAAAAFGAPTQEPGMLDTIGGLAKQGGVGIAKGAIGMAGLPGDARELAAAGAGKIFGDAGADAVRSTFNILPGFSNMPTSDQLQGSVEDVTGEFREPQNTGEEYAETVGSFLPSMIGGGGGLARKGAEAVGAGMASEAAGQLTEDTWLEPIARMLAAVAGGRMAHPAPPKPQRMTGDELQTVKTAAYDDVDKLGAGYSPKATRAVVQTIGSDLAGRKISPIRHKMAQDMFQRNVRPIGQRAQSLTEMDQLRQVIRRDVAMLPDDAEAGMGVTMIKAIDKFLDAVDPQYVAPGVNPAAVIPKMKEARAANARYKKTSMVEDAITKAERQAASTGSGANTDNVKRQAIRNILNNDKKSMGLSPDEIALMEKVVRGTGGQNALRLAGKAAPTGIVSTGLSTTIGSILGNILGGPGGAAAGAFTLPIVGAGVKKLADMKTDKNVEELLALLSTGQKVQPKEGMNWLQVLQAIQNSGLGGYDAAQ